MQSMYFFTLRIKLFSYTSGSVDVFVDFCVDELTTFLSTIVQPPI